MRVLLTGSTGFLGRRVAEALRPRAEVVGVARTRADICTDLTGITPALVGRIRPDVVVHAGAMGDVRTCQREPDLAHQTNTLASETLAKGAANLGITLVFISTDQVFDGAGSWHAESQATAPVNAYGQTKAEAEHLVLAACPKATVVRLALVLGRSTSGRPSASDQVLRALRDPSNPPTLFTDEFRTPVHVDDAARVIADLALAPDRPRILHLGGPDRISRYELGRLLARAAGLDESAIRASTHAEAEPDPRRPADVSLDTTLLREWTDRPPRSIDEAVAASLGQ